MWSMIIQSFHSVVTPLNILLILGGTAFGIICGALPGITCTLGVVLGLSFSFSMNPISAFALLMGLYIGGQSGGLISAILLGIPGTASSIATTFDGYPMAQKGEAGKALGMAIVCSFIGTVFSVIALMFISTAVADLAVKFGPVEMFALCAFALTLVTLLAGKSLIKGLISLTLGMSLAVVGTAPIDGLTRFTLGFRQLRAGISLTPMVVGIFALPTVLTAGAIMKKYNIGKIKIKGFGFSMKEFTGQIRNMVMSAVIGLGIGILPGIGGTTSNLMAYGAVKSTSKYPEKFGTGIIDGIVATETANNTTIGGAMIPLLTLGIPGDGVTAVLLGAFTIHGLTPGPLLFSNSGDFVYAIFTSMLLATFAMLILEFFGIRIFTKLLDMPKSILMPIIMVLCTVGAFSNNYRMFEIYLFLIAGIIGIGLDKVGYPQAPLMLGFLLGGYLEKYLRRGLQATGGSFVQFFTYPIAAVFMVLAVVCLVVNIAGHFRKDKKSTVKE